MITTNSTIKFKKNIDFSDTPFRDFISVFPNISDTEFKVIAVYKDCISFVNETLGAGVISLDEFYKYFEEFVPNTRNTSTDEFEIDPTPYSPKWTDWTEYKFDDGDICKYRYKDTAYGSVKLECKFDYTYDGHPVIGRATCHKDDVFDLKTGIEICQLRAKIKRNKLAIDDYRIRKNTYINHYDTLIKKCTAVISFNESCLADYLSDLN